MSRTNIENIYPLSPMQQGMLFHTLYASQPGAYFVQIGWTLRGALDVVAFSRAWQEVVDRHPILRTAFVWERLEAPMQIVRQRVTLPIEEEDLRALSPDEQALRLQRFLDEDRARGFDLGRAPLMRITLIRLADDAYRLVWSRHHLLLDGWSNPLVFKEVFAFYEAFEQERELRLERPRPYGEYIAWLQKQDAGKTQAFWRRELAGFSAPTPLGVDRPAAEGAEERHAERRITLSDEASAALQAFARNHQLTPNTLLQASWALLLSIYAGERDVLFGTTVSGRSAPLPGIDRMVGLFINTLSVRVKIDAEMPVLAWLQAFQRRQLELREHEHSPLVDVIGWSDVPRGTQLFESLVVFENYPLEESLRQGAGKLAIEGARTVEKSNYPLTLIGLFRKSLVLHVDYDVRRLDGAAAERLLGHLAELLKGFVASPSARVGDLSPLTAAERRTLLVTWNATERAYPRDAGLAALFEAQVDRAPDAIAAVFDGATLSYRELDRRANRVANHLRARGVGPDVPVGLSVRRSMEMVIGMLGVLKAGGAYVPLDPDYPAERLAFMMEDAGVRVVLAQAELAPSLPGSAERVVCLDASSREIEAESDERPAGGARGHHLAYVMYTSGSTGVPKGVCVPQRAVSRLVINSDYVALTPEDRLAQVSNASFDAATFEIWGALLNGARVVGIPKDVALSPRELSSALAAQGITTVFLTTALFNGVVREEPAAFRGVRHVLFGGELVDPAMVRAASREGPERLLHVYGPTETTTFATWHLVEAVPEDATTVPIGRPLANTRLYVLDQRLQPVPIGVPGELYIGGDGVARGYLNRPELTAERFVEDTFAAGGAESRLYKTGDLVRYLPNGDIVFLGRLDDQVKIRGFRIELGEIEAALAKHPQIREAAVLAREAADGGSGLRSPSDKRLCAYVVPSGEARPSAAELRSFLATTLPDYMVPLAFVTLERLPLTINGKIDRKALPAPDVPASEHAYVAPRGAVEEGLASIFAEVLKVEQGRVGAHDGFFELGGHSLLATQAVARVRGAFGVDLPLRALFESSTVAELARHVSDQLEAGRGAAAPPLTRASREPEMDLSFAQERLWFLDQLEPDNVSYVVPLAARVEGRLDRGALALALREVVRRHEVLRTSYRARGERPFAVIHDEVPISLPVTSLTSLPPDAREEALAREVLAEARRRFDLSTGPVIRARLFELGDEDHLILLVLHHIVMDGWTRGVLYREIAALYGAFAEGRESPLPELPIQYADYARWQRQWLQGEALLSQLAYWRQRLAGAPAVLDLPADRPRPAAMTYAGAWSSAALPPALTRAVKELSRREGTTLFMTLLAAFDVVLGRYTGRTDIVVGSPVANRTMAETESLMGFFVNTLVLRVEIAEEGSFRELLQRVKEVCLGAYAHQDVPFERLVQELDPERSTSHSPLFQVLFTLQGAPPEAIALPGLATRRVAAASATAKFDITLAFTEGPLGLVASIEYKTDLFDATTIERMLGHLRTALEAAVKSPERKVWDLPILPADERKRLLVDWNATAAAYPEDTCAHQLFAAEAARTPDAIAARAREEQITYRDLDRRANQLARHLSKLGVGPESLVGLSVGRSIEMVIGVLGILKAGAAYVPLDPSYPVERLAWMLEDSAAPVIVTEERLADDLPVQAAVVVRIDSDWDAIAAEPPEAPETSVGPHNLAYVIYTSGSTGKPKGVMIPHRGLVNYLSWAASAYRAGEGSGAPVHSSIGFDLTVTSLFVPLLSGKTVVLLPEEREIEALIEALAGEPDFSLVKLTPAHLEVLNRLLPAEKAADATRSLVIGGEALSWETLAFWRRNAQKTRLINEYGPTETVVGCSIFDAARAGELSGAVPIGKPIANTTLYVLDARLRPAPIGVPGELHVGGAGVARGYLNQPELTAERFIPDPFSPNPEARLYKTGDLARRRPDGDLEFLGRIDHQVKVRGYRVELGEIESVLGQHPLVREAVALAREDSPGDKRLIAYYVPADEPAPAADELRAFLARRLPEHMVPSAFVRLPAMPLTPNGKVDREALPPPESRGREGGGHVGPRNPIEAELAAIWGDVLDVERPGVHDDFFALGGHSLLATQVMGRVATSLQVELPLHAIFEAPTIAGLAERVDAALRAEQGAPAPPIARVPRDRPLALSFGQERLWFLSQLDPGDVSYLVPLAARLSGPLDVAALEGAIRELSRRHEVLRTTFATASGKPVQVIHARLDPPFTIDRPGPLEPADREQYARAAAAEEARRPFDLATGPLVRARLVELGEDDHLLLLTMHHIVSDAWSLGVLNREIAALYEAFAEGRTPDLPDLPIQYADYAEWQRTWLTGEALDEQLAYWREQLRGAPHVLDLPLDRPRPAARTNRGERRITVLSPDLGRALKELSRREGVTLYMTLLSAFDVLLYRLTGQRDILVGSPIAGRARAETEDLIGFFLNTLVMRAEMSDDMTFRALLQRTKAVCLGAYAHPDLPFERLVQELAPARDMSRSPLFQVIFNLQNTPGEAMDLKGLRRRGVGAEILTVKNDLVLVMAEGPSGLIGYLAYSVDIFDAPTADRMLALFTTLLEGIVADPGRRLPELPLLRGPEREQLVRGWNRTEERYPEGERIHALFQAQRDRTPESLALVAGAVKLSFRELEERANRLAHHLRRRGVGPGTVVGLCLDRSANLVIGLLGILEAGGAYLPLDPAYPRQRLSQILMEAKARVLVTAARLGDVVPSSPDLTVVRLDADSGAINAESAARPEGGAGPGDLVYVLFTSGSTGKPKGVAVEHRQLVNYVRGVGDRLRIPAVSDRAEPGQAALALSTYAHVSTFSADLGNTALFPPLCLGGTLHLVAEELTTDPDALAGYFADNYIDCLKIVPSHLSALLSASHAERVIPRKVLVLGGESSSWELIERIERLAPDCRILNHYGPTETTVGVLTHPVERGRRKEGTAIVPLGRPLPNSRAHVLDPGMQPAPIGVPGEVYIGGAGVARGYLGEPALTAERFVPDPFGDEPGARLYRTGDRARVLPSGDLVFLGRVDLQVKIRGFRVELGEIEAALAASPRIEAAVVLAQEEAPGDRRLVAYVVPASLPEPDGAELKGYLAERLPTHMVPEAFVILPALPLTPNGKIDRRALLAIERRWGGEEAYTPPRSQVEEVLAGIWADVLEREKVGVHESFSELGGHSLLAIQIIARTRDAFQVEVPLRAIFEAPTIAGLAERVEVAIRAGDDLNAPPIARAPRDARLPLSFAQERMWFLAQIEPESPSYNVATAHRISGPLDAAALTRALREIARRHEVLRTTFASIDGRPVQVIHEGVDLDVPVEDLGALAPQARAAAARERAAAEARRPFDLARGPLVRARLYRLSDDDHVLSLTIHHIVSDAITRGVLNRELAILYKSFRAGQASSPLLDLPVQYADYAAWQRRWLDGEVLERQLAYWRKQLAGAPQAIDLPTDRPRPAIQTFNGRWRSFVVPEAVVRGLKELSRREGVTLFMTVLAGFEALLHRYTGQGDVVVGTPAMNRARPETEGLIGLFLNTLVLRTEVSDDLSFLDLVRRVRDVCLGAYAHQDMPFERLVQELEPARDLGRTPLFQVLFTLQSAPAEALSLAGVTVRGLGGGSATAKFDLSLGLADSPGGLVGSFEYNTDLFEAETIDRMVEHLLLLLEGAAEAPDQALWQLPILSEAERERVLALSSGPAAAHPERACVADLFEAQAARTPDAVAVSFAGEELTYRALDEHANQIANHLRAFGVGPDVPVGIAVERSIALVAGILGIFKAGGAYMALDPEYPRERLSFMVEDAKAPVIVTEASLAGTLPPHGATVVLLDADRAEIDARPTSPPDRAGLMPDHLAYLIYTSGSTGRPKGVAMTQRPLVNLIAWQVESTPSALRTLQFASPSFDVCFQEIFSTWCSGGTLVLISSDARRDPERLLAHVIEERVERLFLPPVALYQLADVAVAAPSARLSASLREVIAAGEALQISPRVAAFFAALPWCVLRNQYGPSETHVVTELALSWPPSLWPALPSIGRPIANVRSYLLDAHGQPVPLGVRGELHLGGVAASRGYLGRRDLTEERFAVDPFVDDGTRMYRTGDVARWSPEGNLEFLGRADSQVKIRGFRVELGEIEAVLAESPALREAAVVIRDDGEKRLVAYVVSAAEGAVPSATELRSFLRERLPDYMVPSAFVVLERLPLTASGKVDRRALPAPEKGALAREGRVAPRQPIEEIVAGIFAGVLRTSVDEVGAYDDFFAIGGHSLIATQAMARINAAFAIDLPLRALFEAPTVAGLARRVQTALGAGEAVTAETITRLPQTASRVLSFAQERLWFLAQLEPDNVAYNIPLAIRIGGPLDVDALGRAITEIARRHEILRTTFAEAGGKPAPRVHPAASVPLPVTSFSSLPPGEREEAARRELVAETARPFDLAKGPVLRARLLELDVDDHVLSLTVHHIVSDGWGQGVLARELAALYGAFSRGAESPLPELPIQYADYAAWQRKVLQGAALERQLAYWKGKLAGAPLALDLPADRPRPPVPSHRGAHHAFALPEGLEPALGELARREGVTLFMTLLAAFDVLLHRLAGQDDLLVGTAIAGRARPETEPLIGIFVNTLVMRAELSGEPTFQELLSRVKETCLGAYAHQDMPFERLVQELDPDRDPSRSPLYQVSFALQNMPVEADESTALGWRRFGVEGASAKIDLALAMGTGSRGLMGAFEYSTDLFDAATIERMAARFRTLLKGIVKEPEARIGALPLLSEDEERRLVVEWNATERAYPRDAGLAELFEAQADRSPDAVAAVFDGVEITYRELDRRANRVGHHLRARGVGPDVLVGLCVKRSLEMVIGMLGVSKAGGAYLPLDPDYPAERLAFMMEDTRVPVVLTQAEPATDLPHGTAGVVRLDADWAAIEAESDERPAGGARGHNLAYAIYTSGSTGVPKGVCVPQRAVSRLVINSDYVVLGPADRVAQASNASFDAATFEIWGALLNGARVVGIPKDVALSPRALSSALRAQGITTVFLTTALFNGVVREEPAAFRGVRHVLFGGELVDPAVVRTALREGPERLLHVYGPTETTTFATWHLVEAVAEDATTVPIGRPLANTRLYVLDQRLQPVPIGVPGELYIGGDGVARGYLNRPELTAERFVEDPFAAEGSESRLYKTGDLVRYLPSGEVVFLGRLDNQVKIRGFRIELGEIEAVLVTHPEVREAAVLAREDSGEKRLCAYVVPSGEARPSAADLRSFLAAKLPDYMVPPAFVTLDALPLNENGKVDRGALPAPEVEAPAEREHVEARGPIEEAIAAIFAEVLKIPEGAAVGARDGFFELGGHSLLAMQVIARARATFGVELPLRALFEAPTPAGLGAYVQEALGAGRGAAAPPLVRAGREGPLPLSFAQERLWFLAELDRQSASYVIPLAIRLEGALDRRALERSLDELVRRHEVLRTTFAQVDGRPVQVIHDRVEIALPVWTAEGGTPEERQAAAWRAIQAETRRPFDLAAGPVLRARLFEIGVDDHVLLLTMHHIAADGWSLGVLNREIAALYDAFVAGARSPLPELSIQYADYAVWQRGWLAGAVLDGQLAYWRERLAGAPRSLDLPTDRPRPPVRSARGARRSASLPPEIGRAIAELARREDATLFMTLLAAFDVLLYRYTGQRDLVVGTPIAGRTHAETEGLIGFFVNMLPLRVELGGDITFRALVARVKEVCLGAYAHQDLPFERLVQEISPERDLGRTPIFQVSFVVQAASAAAMALPGLARRWIAAETATAKLDLHVSLTESRGALVCGVEYATDLFDAATIERMVGHLEVLLRGIAADPDQPISRLPILPEEEEQRLLVEWNRTERAYPRDAGLAELFEAQVDRAPDAIAAVFDGIELTYAELDRLANRVARHLRARGVGPDVLVGLCLRRSMEMMIGTLGALKAGGAYLPLDPDYPAERLAFMMEDARVPVVLTQADLAASLPRGSARVVRLDADWGAIAEESDERPIGGARGHHLAYVIYTSGSTGVPKGVCVPQRAVSRLVINSDYVVLGPADRLAQVSNASFDAATFEIWGALLNGGRLVGIPRETVLSPAAFAAALREHGITAMFLTSALFNGTMREQPAAFRGVRSLLVGGEAVDPAWMRAALRDGPERLLNGYGPTESTTFAVTHHVEAVPEGATSVPIGRPIANTTLYVLDAAMLPVPIGVPGELHIGGDGLARGYLNRPELTAERFVPDPFSADSGAKLYKTGDLVRYLPSGDVVFLGRLDDQVKIRGFRIELGEIEAALAKHPRIQGAAVLAREDRPGEKRLVAYVAPREGEAPAPEDLMIFLRATLPDYLVPRAYVTLAAIPLNANGKVDRRALPAPEAGGDEAAHVEPRTPTEQTLAAIWREVLEIDRVGAHDNFFVLGGHSLLATRVTARVLGSLGVDVALARVFEAPTLAGLAEVIDALRWAEGAPPPAGEADDVEEGAL